MMKHSRLSLGTKIGYGIADLGGNLFFTIMSFWLLKFLTDTLGLSAALAGIALLIGRVWDAITDPLMGAISDATRTRWGRRRPYLLFGSLFVILGMVAVFWDVSGYQWGNIKLFAWVIFSVCFVNTAYTIVFIPYGALTPDLTDDFQERTRLNAHRMSWAIIGTLLGAGLFTVIVDFFSNGSVGSGYTGAALFFGCLSAIVILITFFVVREKVSSIRKMSIRNVLRSYIDVLKVRPFLLSVVPWMLFMTGVVIVTSTVPYYFQYLYQRPELATYASLALLVSAFLSIPFWVAVSARIGKAKVYNIGMMLLCVSLLAASIFADIHLIVLFVIMVIAGVGLSTNYVMPWSIIPDVVDYDQMINKHRREGVFYGMWTFLQKVGLGLAVAVSGSVLELTGYTPGIEQSPLSLFGIRLLIGPVPAIFFILGMLILRNYPITRLLHNEIILKIKSNQ